MREKWENLLKHLEIRAASSAVPESLKHLEIEPDLNLKPCNESDITEFEAKHAIILPSEYKMFCQVFGSVTFGDVVNIGCTDLDDIESYRDLFREILLDYSRDGMYNDFDNVERESFDKISELIEHGMRFGGNSSNESDFWFDLRTYGADESYDIYCVYTEQFTLHKLPVRNFFDFIREYCLGTKLYEPDLSQRDTIPCEPHEFFISSI